MALRMWGDGGLRPGMSRTTTTSAVSSSRWPASSATTTPRWPPSGPRWPAPSSPWSVYRDTVCPHSRVADKWRPSRWLRDNRRLIVRHSSRSPETEYFRYCNPSPAGDHTTIYTIYTIDTIYTVNTIYTLSTHYLHTIYTRPRTGKLKSSDWVLPVGTLFLS